MLNTPGGFRALICALGLLQGSIKPSRALSAALIPEPTPHLSARAPSIGAVSYAKHLNSKDDSCYVAPYDSPPVDLQAFASFDQAKATVYRYRQQQSVNMGSWFVHEQWMTPSVFKCADGGQISEVDIAHGWGSTESARSVLERHWDTFVNETDFQYLSSIGINTVRLPIGYWNLGPDFVQGTPYEDVGDVYQYSWPRIVRTINMADRYGIGVLVDLHGAVGSQNGQQHSGISDGTARLFDDPENIQKTMNVLTFLIQSLVNVSNVVGIQILNEPNNVDSLPDFYSQAISTMRAAAQGAANFPLYLHDGFDLDRFSKFVADRTDFVVQDHHSYFVFTPSDQSEGASGHTADVKGPISSSLVNASNGQHRNLVVDEWSCALTTQSLQNEGDPDQAQRNFCTGQMEVYANATAGWSFWAYRKEKCNDDSGWCFEGAVGKALPSTFFSYGAGTPGDPASPPSALTLASGMNTSPIQEYPPSVHSSSYSYDGDYQRYENPTKRSQNGRKRRSNTLRKREQTKCSLRRSEGYGSSSSSTAQSATPSNDSLEQRVASKGYSDGYLTAKIFAQYGTSKLGFIGQYIHDSIATLGPTVIPPTTEDLYSDRFMKGLRAGEDAVRSNLANS